MRCDITILSGDDSLTLPLASVGGKGVISVVANIVPADVKAMTDLILEGDLVKARQWHQQALRPEQEHADAGDQPDPDQGRDGDARHVLRGTASAHDPAGRQQEDSPASRP